MSFMKKSSTSMFATLFLFVTIIAAKMASAKLEIGFYNSKCPEAEALVRETVRKAVAGEPGFAAGIIRLHFHDCFVRGCDASLLLDSPPGQTSAEKDAIINSSLRGFKVIDAAKAAVETYCPRTISCSDILAFAARDSVYFTGGIDYKVPSGRRDGKFSYRREVFSNFPSPVSNVYQLMQNFSKKGLSLDDMVTLSGAHSLGHSHCFSFSDRIYGSNTIHTSINSSFADYLISKCPPSTANIFPLDSRTVSLDPTPAKLDNVYYKALRKRRGLLTSDQTLYESPLTRKMVKINAKRPKKWAVKFAGAMVRMGLIEVLTGSQGEIRENCRVSNAY